MKKWFLISVMVLAGSLLTSGEAKAQSIGCDSSYYVCDDGVWGDPGSWGSGGYAGAFAKCTDRYGCLNCVLTPDKTAAMCVRVYGHDGYCQCQNPRVVQRYGGAFAECDDYEWCDFK